MSEKKSGGFIQKLATFIVDKRNLFFLLYVFAAVFCVFSMNWVQVENDVTTYLPEDTETRQGLVAMNENFATFGTAQVMVSNVTYETAQALYGQLVEIEGVDMVTFDDTPDHYTNASALFDVSFAGSATDEASIQAMGQIEETLASYDTSIYTTVGVDENAMLQEEMTTILIVAVVIIVVVLLLTSRSYMEVPVLLITFGAAALLNMGTNFLLGKISFISNSVAVVLQLALAIDYAIILCHRFSDEHETQDARTSAITALSKAIPEISASSLTTVSGLAALGFMKFTIGLDLAMVLIKAILLSLLSVFTLMPGLLVLFCPLIDKTKHKKLLPNITFAGKFAVKTRRVVPFLFTALLVGAYWLSSNCPFAYSYTNLKTDKMSEQQTAHFKIVDTFGDSNMVAVVVPSGDYEAESRILETLNSCPEVKSTMGLSGIEAMDGYKLTDSLNPRELSELVGLDYEVVQLLYTAYAAENDQYGQILSGLDEYSIPLFDMFIYLKDQINTTAQQNSVEIGDITMDTLTASESADTTTDIGGIAGLSSGVVRDCVNRGNVGYQQMGYNIGGIAGTQSGYITGCKNYAQIQGRKEVGGIVGQMEPAAVIEYTEDTLQILQGQLNTMSGLVGQASSNAQSNASQITGQIGVLQDQAKTARDAADTLFPSGESSQLPDVDTILAAQNTLTTTINAMPGTLNSIAAATQNTVSGLTSDLQAVSGQISAMGQTINGASENLGGSITDISDQDTPENYTGKVESCANYGSVLADLNVGGIAGAMAMENDLDIQEDWEENGDTSLNFSSEVRAVILRCENSGLVTGNKQHAGGIVGWQALGLVKSCVNTGQLDGENADYVGGISGTSGGFIRGCSAKGYIHGSTYVGGIAGSASIVTDCRSMVVIADGSERLGAILGGQEEAGADEETPISGNFYVSVAQDMGAIDGISYTSLAEPLDLETFLALESLPEIFRSVTVCFQQEDGTEKRISLASGGSLDPANVPPVPEKEGYVGQWQGLEDAELSNIVFDMTFPASYTAYHTTIQSEAVQGDGLPVLLVQGAFTGDSQVAVSPAALTPAVAEKETLVEAWDVALSGTVQVTGGRLRIPEDADMGHGKLLVRDENGAWREVEYTTDDSYLVFPMDSGDTGVAVVKTAAFPWQAAAIAAGAALLALGALGIFLRIRKGRKKPRSEQPQA